MYGGGSRKGQIQVVQKGVEIVIGMYVKQYSATKFNILALLL